ncbi:MAG: hypothetical protein ACI9PP_000553 [Halobacteriales archaeon]|jgi:hypothetical protein
MPYSTRRAVLRTAGAAGLAGLLGSSSAAAKAESIAKHKRANQQFAVQATQSDGNSVHWILPGPRRIDPYVFGTPDDGPSSPQRGDDHIAHKIWYFKQHRPEIVGLLAGDHDHKPLPLPVGLPEKARATNDDEDRYTRTTIPVPFSDKTIGSEAGNELDGALDLKYIDRAGFEGQGNGPDEIDFDVWFTDPDGNRYEFDIHHLETHDGAHPHGRGIMTGVYMHGITPIGTPLMPTQYAFGSLWAVGDLLVNGEVTHENNRDRTIHLMTTQNVRTADYNLAIDEELPLGADGNPDPYLGSQTVTHVFLPPIQVTDDGPRRVPLKPAFELPNVKPQPFIHFMFDEDTVTIDQAAYPPNRPGPLNKP